MRPCLWSILAVACAVSAAAADDGIHVRSRRFSETTAEPWLHLDPATTERPAAEGGIVDGRAAVLDLGPRARIAAEGTWWQTGLAPSMFAADLPFRGWLAGGELTYDLGLFRIGINAAMTHTRDELGDSTHRMVGLFAYRTFRLSRWMHAWILLGVAYEQWTGAGFQQRQQGTTVGLSLGTTFR